MAEVASELAPVLPERRWSMEAGPGVYSADGSAEGSVVWGFLAWGWAHA
jgi:hypothetical protein